MSLVWDSGSLLEQQQCAAYPWSHTNALTQGNAACRVTDTSEALTPAQLAARGCVPWWSVLQMLTISHVPEDSWRLLMPGISAILFGLVLPQMYSQLTFIQDPVANDVKYQAAAQPFLVFGILTTALAVGHHSF